MIVVPSTGQKGIKIRLLEEGIVPCWLDLQYLQLWAGSVPLGCLNGAESDAPPAGGVKVCRMLDGSSTKGTRKVVAQNEYSLLRRSVHARGECPRGSWLGHTRLVLQGCQADRRSAAWQVGHHRWRRRGQRDGA